MFSYIASAMTRLKWPGHADPRIRGGSSVVLVIIAAAMMTSTTLLPPRILGSAWPGHFNRVIAEAMYENIKQVGLPQWSEADQRLAHALQREIGAPDSGLATRLDTLRPALKPNERN